jgi:hypothetical protein
MEQTEDRKNYPYDLAQSSLANTRTLLQMGRQRQPAIVVLVHGLVHLQTVCTGVFSMSSDDLSQCHLWVVLANKCYASISSI